MNTTVTVEAPWYSFSEGCIMYLPTTYVECPLHSAKNLAGYSYVHVVHVNVDITFDALTKSFFVGISERIE